MKSLPGSLDRLFWLGIPCAAKQEPVARLALLATHPAAALLPTPLNRESRNLHPEGKYGTAPYTSCSCLAHFFCALGLLK